MPARPHRRLRALAAAVACAALFAAFVPLPAAAAADPAKVLRIASPDIDTLDPQAYSEDPSFRVVMAIYEALYEWDYLAPTPQLAPLTADGPPEISADGRVWTIRLQHGIRFTDDPAFGGRPRELTAADYVYSLKRWMDPNGRRGGAPLASDLIIGARAAVEAARGAGRFDYERPLEGLRALDRYTLQIKLSEPNYPVVRDLLTFVGAAAREVVDAAGADIRTRAVGTGAFRLREWKRGSRLILDANPDYRGVRFPASADPQFAALERSMEGKTLPRLGSVEIAIIDEELPRLLQFDRGDLDVVELRGEVATRMLAGDRLRPELAARGIVRHVFPEPFLFSVYFNTVDPVLGGMGNARVALRRAVALALDVDALLKVVYAGQALAANQIVPPGVGGHDPALPPRGPAEPAAAQALLDRFGYARGADGYRRQPDGAPLTLTLSQRSGAISREIATLWKKNMDAIGLRMEFREVPFQDMIKELEKGQFQLYYGGFGGSPSGYPELAQMSRRQSQRVNVTRFSNDDYERALDAYFAGRSEAEQVAAARRMSDLARTYVPQLPAAFRLESNFVQPWVQGYRPPVFQTYWKYLDLDLDARRRAGH
jgi:ABC-type transport system substrate-binding protein